MDLKLNPEVKEKIIEWQKWRAMKNQAEKRDKELNSELRTLVRATLQAAGVNDWTNPVQVGDENLYLNLEFHDPIYRAAITAEMVGTRPLQQSGYEVLKVTEKGE